MVSDLFLSSYAAARDRSVACPRAEHGWLVVSGTDRASYLQGLLTNDIVRLTAGTGCYAAYLTPQGRMITDLTVYELGDVLLLALPAEVRHAVLAKLDQFVFSEDVQLGDATDSFAGVSIVGPDSPGLVAHLVGSSPDAMAQLPEHGNLRASFEQQPCIVLRVGDRGELAFDLLVDVTQRARLAAVLHASGVEDAASGVAEALRIEGGIPRFHLDMDEETIPLEAGIEPRAISLTKGCYVGQEVIIRVLHRGHGRVARKLVGLTLSDEVPAAGDAIGGDGRTVGKVTSATWSPALQRPIALGYVHRDFIAPGTFVSVAGHDAVVTALPFHQ